MKKIELIFILVLIVALSGCILAVSAEEKIDGLNVSSDLNKSLDDAKANNKTVLLIFDQSSCTYCDMFKKDVLSNSTIQKELNKKYNVVIVDMNKEYNLASKYKVVGTPTEVFLNSNGDEIHKVEGYVPPAEFSKELKEI